MFFDRTKCPFYTISLGDNCILFSAIFFFILRNPFFTNVFCFVFQCAAAVSLHQIITDESLLMLIEIVIIRNGFKSMNHSTFCFNWKHLLIIYTPNIVTTV
ncbi:hypothetical protein BBD46_19555 [Natrialba sp. SSL1]|nr:hypothetical protein BBD46_19555 [Natrialba sp. SSL1]